MNRRYLATAVLMGGTALLHGFGGEVTVHRPLLDTAASGEMALYTTLLWHFVTAFLIWGTVIFALAARPGTTWHRTAQQAGLLTLLMGLLFVLLGLVRLGEIWTAPQWILLVPIGAVALWPGPKSVPDHSPA